MKKLLLLTVLISGLTLSACSTLGINQPSCYQSVAISKVAYTEAYEHAAELVDEDILNASQGAQVLIVLDQADGVTDKASALCPIDERTARDYIDVANNLIDQAFELMEVGTDG